MKRITFKLKECQGTKEALASLAVRYLDQQSMKENRKFACVTGAKQVFPPETRGRRRLIFSLGIGDWIDINWAVDTLDSRSYIEWAAAPQCRKIQEALK